MEKVTELSSKSKYVLSTPEQTLSDALKSIETGTGVFGPHTKKLLVLAVDEREGCYNLGFVQTGMKMSECVAMCEVAKAVFLTEMKY